MHIHVHPYARRGAIIAAAGIALVAGCSAASDHESDGEKTTSSQQAYTAIETITVTQQDFTRFAGLIDLDGCTLGISGNQGVLTPSGALTAFLTDGDGGPVDPAQHAIKFPVPSFSVQAPDPFGPFQVTIESLGTSDLTTDLETSDVHAHANVTGFLHLHSPNIFQPDFDIEMNGTVDALVGLSSNSLSLDSLVFDVSSVGLDCSNLLFPDPLCAFFTGHLPDMSSKLNDAVMPVLQPMIADPSVYNAFLGVLLQVADTVEQPTGGTGWSIWGSPTLQNGVLTFQVMGTLPPTTPNCGAVSYANCDGSVTVVCGYNTDTMQPEELVNGAWTPTGQPVAPGSPYTTTDFPVYPGANTTGTYRVCATDSAGKTCGGSFTATGGPYTCSYGGNGGGGSGGKACGGHICPQ